MMGNKLENSGVLRFALLVATTLHAALSLVFLTCFITDRFNTAMAFINNSYTKHLLIWNFGIFAVILVLSALQKVINRPVALMMSLYGILQATLVVLVRYDIVNPSAILFTKESVKLLFANASLLGFALSVVIQVGLSKKKRV